ncbi:MAG: hypothetical protein Q9226_000099 [Calogaya cf. arnoldii]
MDNIRFGGPFVLQIVSIISLTILALWQARASKLCRRTGGGVNTGGGTNFTTAISLPVGEDTRTSIMKTLKSRLPSSLNARAAALASGVMPASTPLSLGMQANFKGFTFIDGSTINEQIQARDANNMDQDEHDDCSDDEH